MDWRGTWCQWTHLKYAGACSFGGKYSSPDQLSACVSPALRDSYSLVPAKGTGKKHSHPHGSCFFSGGILTQSKEGAAQCNQPPLEMPGRHFQTRVQLWALVSHGETMQLLPKGAVSLQLLLKLQLYVKHNPIKICSFPLFFCQLLQVDSAMQSHSEKHTMSYISCDYVFSDLGKTKCCYIVIHMALQDPSRWI